MSEGMDRNVNARLGRLEQVTSRLEARAEGTDHKLDEQARVLANINTKLDRRTETSWPVVISSVALLATIGTLALSPINEQLNSFMVSQRRQWDEIRRIERAGHIPTEVRLSALETASDRMRQELIDEIKDVDDDSRARDLKVDEVVQREMRILDEVQLSRFEKEDQRLQREMDLKDEIVQKSSSMRHEKVLGLIGGLKERIDRIENEQTRRTDRVYKRPDISP